MTQVSTTSERATVTFHTSPRTKARLEKLAEATRRSKSFLSNEALEQYLSAEEAFIASVERGKADMAADRTFSTAEARAQVAGHFSQS